jgi:hypothetical protein
MPHYYRQAPSPENVRPQPYSPECVEGLFSEVRRHGVLGSWRILREGQWLHSGPSQMLLRRCCSMLVFGYLVLALRQRTQDLVAVLPRY